MATKRDRAAYMRDYRAKRKVEAPTLTDALRRIAVLEARLGINVDHEPQPHPVLAAMGLDAHGNPPGVDLITPAANRRQASGFGSPRPAPKGK